VSQCPCARSPRCTGSVPVQLGRKNVGSTGLNSRLTRQFSSSTRNAATAAIGAAAPAPAASAAQPGGASLRALRTHVYQQSQQRTRHISWAHYTTLASLPSFRDRRLCSTRLPHRCGCLLFQRLSAGPVHSYLRAIFASRLVPLHDVPSTNILSSAVNDSTLREALPSSMINAAVAPLRGGLLLVALDFSAWTQDAHLLDALLRALLYATQPSSGTQLQLPFSSSPPSPIDAAAAALHVGISLVSSDARVCALDAQLRVPCALLCALLRASWRLAVAQPRVTCTSSSSVQLLPPSLPPESIFDNAYLHMHVHDSLDTLAHPLIQCASLLAVPFVSVSPLALLCASSSPLPSSQAVLPSAGSSLPLHLYGLRSFSTRCSLRLAGGGDREDSPSVSCL